ncbi:MAG: N,N-diacetyllegionaminate synthase [Clostridia bacterium]|nr:N,N-diacetyllegionaminate synthase [Clostridia bacterium]
MKVYIIAEAGVNHNGDIELAKKMVDEAKRAGADCIKFQTFIAEKIVSKNAVKAEYQCKKAAEDESQLEMIKKLQLSFVEFKELYDYCQQKEIDFLSTPFDLESIDFLAGLGMDRWKIPSGEITNLPYLLRIARYKKPVILSTGMSTVEETRAAVEVLKKTGIEDITLLHCNTEYPTPYEDVNLKAIVSMRKLFKLPVGYSDHTLGIEVPVAAVALGAPVIEKHFTLDKTLPGPDHKASLEPEELREMVQAIRNIEKAMGDGVKKPSPSEIKNMCVVRKSIVAKRSIKKGEVFTEENITVKRPGSGISPMRWFEVLGKVAKKDFLEDEMIEI